MGKLRQAFRQFFCRHEPVEVGRIETQCIGAGNVFLMVGGRTFYACQKCAKFPVYKAKERAKEMTPYVCTAERPWTPSFGEPVVHPDCYEVGEQRDGYPGGDLQDYKCPNCGTVFTVELPQ